MNASAVCLISTTTGTKAHKIISVFFLFFVFSATTYGGKKKGNQHQGNKTLLKSDNEKEIGLNT